MYMIELIIYVISVLLCIVSCLLFQPGETTLLFALNN